MKITSLAYWPGDQMSNSGQKELEGDQVVSDEAPMDIMDTAIFIQVMSILCITVFPLRQILCKTSLHKTQT